MAKKRKKKKKKEKEFSDEIKNKITKIENNELDRMKLTLNSLEKIDEPNKSLDNLFEAAKKNISLRSLTLNVGSILKDSFDKLVELLKENKGLCFLDLQNNALGDQDIREIFGALEENCTLSELKIHNNNMTISGLNGLTESIKKNKGLVKLTIDHFDESVSEDFFEKISANKSLLIFLKGNEKFSKKGIINSEKGEKSVENSQKFLARNKDLSQKLIMQIEKGHVNNAEDLERLFGTSGSAITCYDNRKYTPLHIVTQLGRLDLAIWILQKVPNAYRTATVSEPTASKPTVGDGLAPCIFVKNYNNKELKLLFDAENRGVRGGLKEYKGRKARKLFKETGLKTELSLKEDDFSRALKESDYFENNLHIIVGNIRQFASFIKRELENNKQWSKLINSLNELSKSSESDINFLKSLIESGIEKCKHYLDNLPVNQLLSEFNLKNVINDGNGLFRAISCQLENKINYKGLREEVIKYEQTHQGKFEDFDSEYMGFGEHFENNFEKHIEHIKEPNSWAGYAEMLAITGIYKRPLCTIVKDNGNLPTVYVVEVKQKQKSRGLPLYLLCLKRKGIYTHFHALEPKENSNKMERFIEIIEKSKFEHVDQELEQSASTSSLTQSDVKYNEVKLLENSSPEEIKKASDTISKFDDKNPLSDSEFLIKIEEKFDSIDSDLKRLKADDSRSVILTERLTELENCLKPAVEFWSEKEKYNKLLSLENTPGNKAVICYCSTLLKKLSQIFGAMHTVQSNLITPHSGILLGKRAIIEGVIEKMNNGETENQAKQADRNSEKFSKFSARFDGIMKKTHSFLETIEKIYPSAAPGGGALSDVKKLADFVVDKRESAVLKNYKESLYNYPTQGGLELLATRLVNTLKDIYIDQIRLLKEEGARDLAYAGADIIFSALLNGLVESDDLIDGIVEVIQSSKTKYHKKIHSIPIPFTEKPLATVNKLDEGRITQSRIYRCTGRYYKVDKFNTEFYSNDRNKNAKRQLPEKNWPKTYASKVGYIESKIRPSNMSLDDGRLGPKSWIKNIQPIKSMELQGGSGPELRKKQSPLIKPRKIKSDTLKEKPKEKKEAR